MNLLNTHLDFENAWIKFEDIEYFCKKSNRSIIEIKKSTKHDLFLGDLAIHYVITTNI